MRFSPPLPHGQDGSEFGHVVAVTVDDGMRFVHASDLQGPASPVATAYLLRERPDLVYLSGPPTYLQSQVGHDVVQRGIDNLVRLVGETGCRVIVDHHAVREPRFRERLAQAFDTGRVVTAAEYLGSPRRVPRGMAGRAVGPAAAGAAGRARGDRRAVSPGAADRGGGGSRHVGDAEGGRGGAGHPAPGNRRQGVDLAAQRGKPGRPALLRP